MKITFHDCYKEIISIDNLLEAWREFIKGKKSKTDVQKFSIRLMDNILALHYDLLQNNYKHGSYKSFNICDPKPRKIHKAPVRDRLLHHAVYRVLYPFFNRTFTADSFSCRNKKGTHKALDRFREFANKVSVNNTKTCWVLKCDIRKFFANIDHRILLDILDQYIKDPRAMNLLGEIIDSHSSGKSGVGLPLGNLTSQLFVNIYMNELDQFTKHKLKTKYYIRYADDFVIFSRNKPGLEGLILKIGDFLFGRLKLSLHSDKLFIKTLASGVDFLGWINFPDHKILRTTSKQRMLKRIRVRQSDDTLNSYLGLLSHGNTYKLREKILEACKN